MRTAIIQNGSVLNVVMLDGLTVDADGKAARGPTSYIVTDHDTGAQDAVAYEAIYPAPDGCTLAQSDTAGLGWTWTQAGGFVAPPLPPPGPRKATGSQLLAAMTDDQAKAWQAAVDAGTPAVRAYWNGGYRDPLPETNPKLVRLAGNAKVDLKALFDAALGTTAS